MVDQADFLVELGTEELPPRALMQLATAFADGIGKGLADARIAGDEVKIFATPRRLAVQVADVPLRQQDSSMQKRGPAVKAAFDDSGAPTKAALGFARSNGVEVTDLDRLKTDQGEWLICNQEQKGAATSELLPGIVSAALAALPIPKRMRWGDRDVEFVRPAHWLLMLLGPDVVEAEVLGLRSGRVTRGHRFHSQGELTIAKPSEYGAVLMEQGKVIVDFAERRASIAAAVAKTAAELGGEALVEDALLDEVTALVEWPVPVAGKFDTEFLEIPSEVLITTMKDNQKYFPLFAADGQLLPMFITISNIDSIDSEKVRTGNEVVIRPRLADAMFFWLQDQKNTLFSHAERLKKVVFQSKLGSVYDKSERCRQLALTIASKIGADANHTQRAGELAKCDLMTEMVGEFPSLQGKMGQYYAALEGEPEEVSSAIFEHYLPRFADDKLAGSAVGQSLAIADRLDTLVGIFGIGQKPTGVKDPFALRRLSLAVLRTMIECELELDLEELLAEAATGLANNVGNNIIDVDATSDEVFDFMLERLRAYYLAQSISPQVFEAVALVRPTSPLDFDRRVKAVSAFMQLPEAESLAAANKRINNILKKNNVVAGGDIDGTLFEHDAEKLLFAAITERKAVVEPLFAAGDYNHALQALASLRKPVDRYFEEVMVMADDLSVRANRFAVLAELKGLFSHVAELGGLQS